VNRQRVVIVGAGVGGLSAAADLARAGFEVTVVERADEPGGKMRQLPVGGEGVDAGPTVFTMRWVFEQLFDDAGARLDQRLPLYPADTLARHAWTGGGALDLHASVEASCRAIEQFASTADARGYREFCARSADIYRTLEHSFIAAQRPNPVSLAGRVGFTNIAALWRTAPYLSLWRALGSHFQDGRLRQLFARYATYVGSSPMQAPATLMLIAHVEQEGVWLVGGGMRALALALKQLGEEQGAIYRFSSGVREIQVSGGRVSGVVLDDGEPLPADRVVFNGDVSALGTGQLGDGVRKAAPPVSRPQRGLSAVTWCLRGQPSGFPMHYHNVFFDRDYAAEFDTIFAGRDVVQRPTVYLCAQDRISGRGPDGPERMLMLVNAPADGDRRHWREDELSELRERALSVLSDCGAELAFRDEDCRVTSPTDFAGLFPGSGGSLYGRAAHGMMASFARPGAVSAVPGLYLAGGSVHPGPGVPMSALSGRLAAAAIVAAAAGGR
jgi:1-hydroxycarotenoid 3,4-desaturase